MFTTMRSYVITFYRGEGEGHPSAVIGAFHDPAAGSERAFHGLTELQALIEASCTAWSAGRPDAPPLPPARQKTGG